MHMQSHQEKGIMWTISNTRKIIYLETSLSVVSEVDCAKHYRHQWLKQQAEQRTLEQFHSNAWHKATLIRSFCSDEYMNTHSAVWVRWLIKHILLLATVIVNSIYNIFSILCYLPHSTSQEMASHMWCNHNPLSFPL